MSKKAIINEINELIKELDNIDHKDASLVLGWFYKAIYFNNMYEDKNISSYIYSKLQGNGYKEPIDEIGTTQELYQLLSRNDGSGENAIAVNIISQIMGRLKNSEMLDEAINSYIRYYNETFNKQLIMQNMMSLLKKSIGERIVFVRYINNNFQIGNGVIDNVEEYQAVTINGERIPFIGYNTGIKTINTVDGRYLYNNNLLVKDSNLEDALAIKELNEKTFGSSYENVQTRIY